MKKRYFPILLALAAAHLSFAEALPGTPASTNAPGADYPRILSDNRILFQIEAPNAQTIAFHTDKTYPASKDDKGIWTATTDPQVPGFHYYWLVIDDVRVNDPASETFYGTGKQTSGIEVPESGDAGAYYQTQNVPHGEIRERWYHSSVTEGPRRFFLYTPPGYDQSPDTRYPVLFLQHGGGEDERAWPIQGRVANIMDNLIAAGEAEPMLFVMERGYALRPGEEPIPFRMGPDVSMEELNRQMLKRFASFEAVILEDVIPLIDAKYRTIPDRHHRAIAGFSMGGFQAYMIGLQNLDTFASIGGLSGTGHFGTADIDPETYYGGVFADPDAFNEKMDLMFFGHGTHEPERMMDGFNAFHANLTRVGIDHVYFKSEGTGHEWLTERRNLRELAKRLFK
ncbi:alpha/beta hydrolase-fold protein [Pelagicoccus sp. SDUM812003]|uniref:alpha/beta hydrolase-fold protein n=1 Tax=Pelagicoccus sp. SDUM812003 TaxID=3041267 RepID=UPI00280CF93E|nr:alpha/beta hydrolase-fold protein [Pelagicoccus sp. SDUM812003]MDQ8203489.1 alpha/beta hydrolase-fold protein [Pelagicoccus sp. SDUM812003]